MQQSVFDSHAVLLVEDNPDDAFLMQSAWKSAKIPNQLPTVTDGEQALAYLEGTGEYSDRKKYPMPIAIFLDLKLPRVDGLEVLAAIRRNPNLRHLHVEVLSASARDVDVRRANELGANSYIVKPSRVQELIEMLTAWRTLARFKMYVLPEN
ncbi:MAG TPA: response regulator [Verrucomicrobiae bacterium]